MHMHSQQNAFVSKTNYLFHGMLARYILYRIVRHA